MSALLPGESRSSTTSAPRVTLEVSSTPSTKRRRLQLSLTSTNQARASSRRLAAVYSDCPVVGPLFLLALPAASKSTSRTVALYGVLTETLDTCFEPSEFDRFTHQAWERFADGALRVSPRVEKERVQILVSRPFSAQGFYLVGLSVFPDQHLLYLLRANARHRDVVTRLLGIETFVN